MAAPALPWGVSDPGQNVPHGEPAISVECSSLEALGLALGDRVEVKWQMDNEENGSSYIKWWGAKIMEQCCCSPASLAYKIRWDSADGFEEEDGVIAFTSEHTLLNLSATAEADKPPPSSPAAATTTQPADPPADAEAADDDADDDGIPEMLWRREGDSWDHADSDDDGDMAEAGKAVLITPSQYEQMCAEQARSEGKSLDEWGMEGFNQLPAQKQRQLAEGFCQFRDKFVAFLEQAKASGDIQDDIITVDHVERFKRQL